MNLSHQAFQEPMCHLDTISLAVLVANSLGCPATDKDIFERYIQRQCNQRRVVAIVDLVSEFCYKLLVPTGKP